MGSGRFAGRAATPRTWRTGTPACLLFVGGGAPRVGCHPALQRGIPSPQATDGFVGRGFRAEARNDTAFVVTPALRNDYLAVIQTSLENSLSFGSAARADCSESNLTRTR